MWRPFVLALLIVGVVSRQSLADSSPEGFPRFSWATLPVFWHAWGSEPFNASTLAFINRFPLVTIEKGMSGQTPPLHTGAEKKILAGARQVKEYNSTIKVLFYLNSQMDWKMYDLHQYCEQHPQLMWLHDSRGQPVQIRDENLFDLRNEAVHKVWLDVLRNASRSGWIDGAFVDRGGDPIERQSPFKYVDAQVFQAYLEGHQKLMNEINTTFGSNFLAVSNGKDYDTVNGRMFEKFFLDDTDRNTPYADIVTLQHESTFPHIAEVHAEPCNVTVFNTTLAAYLIGAGQYAYYGCTSGFSLESGWLRWFPEYSKPLGAPLSVAKTISTATGFCKPATMDEVSRYFIRNPFWEDLQEYAKTVGFKRHLLKKWIRQYREAGLSLHGDDGKQPVLGRRFQSGTCVTVDFNSWPPQSCIAWADGTHTGSSRACL
eukprot:scpid73363/ scgid12223/ 